MAIVPKITIRGKPVTVAGKSKADVARFLLEGGYTVSEISKAVPMAYSQVHQLAKKLGSIATEPWGDPGLGRKAKTKPQSSKLLKPGTAPRVGKLRTPGLPSDVDVGECANCGYDVAIRKLVSGFAFIHINTSAEVYLAVTQFCTAMPKVLLK